MYVQSVIFQRLPCYGDVKWAQKMNNVRVRFECTNDAL